MTTKKYIYISFISLLIAIVCWTVFLVFDPSGLELFLTVNAFAFSITFLCFLVICIVKALGKSVSPYRIFAVTDGILALGVAGYAVYDILTDTGWFAGLFGMVLLIFVLPIILALLLVDFIVWKIKTSKKNRSASQ